MKAWNLLTQTAAIIVAVATFSFRARAAEICSFALMEDDVQDAAEELVTSGIEKLLSSNSIKLSDAKIEVESHWTPIPYSIQGMDGKPFSGENISLIILGKVPLPRSNSVLNVKVSLDGS
jgi:hypothetical protein